MSWLDQQKAKADKDKAEREAKEAQDRAWSDRRHQASIARAAREHKEKFADLEGKVCWQEIDGHKKKLGKFRSEVKDTQIVFFAGEIKLGEIRYWQRENERYDNDGCSEGTGEYYETSDMILYLPYTKKDGTKVVAQTPKYSSVSYSYQGCCYEDYLGEYLLNFIKP